MVKKHDFVETWIDKPQRILIGGVVIGLGGYLAYKVGGSLLKSINKNTTQSQAGESVEIQQATVLRAAMNPSGFSWMMSFDTTDNKTILSMATQIVKLEDVISAYRKLYDSDLLSDLQSELSAEDYKNFISVVSGNSSRKGGATQTYAQKTQPIVAKVELFVRSSPDASYHGAFYEVGENNNIIVKAKAGAFIGYATGKQAYDSKNDVKFIEVGYQFPKTGLPASVKAYAGKTYIFWVSSSTNYVDKFGTTKEMLAKYSSLSNEVLYKKPIGTLSGITEQFAIPVITKQRTHILDTQMQPNITVESKTLLGEYLMTLNTGKMEYIKFRTIDNTERWVQANAVILKTH